MASLNLDLLCSVAERTLLSPFFVVWLPVLALAQHSLPFFRHSLLFFALVSLRSALRWSSRAWLNRRSRSGRLDWSQQLVLVTGASGGLGRVLVETLLLSNVAVIALDIVPFSDTPSQDQGELAFYQCNVADPEAVKEVAHRIRAEHGSPTILINNAGSVTGKLIVDLQPQEVINSFGANVLSHFYFLKEFLPQMIHHNSGHVVTISSTLGQLGVAQCADYCASKAASILLHHSLRQELNSRHGCHSVRTTLVCPGKLETKMFDKLKPQNQFLMPAIPPHDLVKKIIQSLDKEESTEIYIPFYSNWVWALRLAPSWVLDLAHYITGSNDAMRNF